MPGNGFIRMCLSCLACGSFDKENNGSRKCNGDEEEAAMINKAEEINEKKTVGILKKKAKVFNEENEAAIAEDGDSGACVEDENLRTPTIPGVPAAEEETQQEDKLERKENPLAITCLFGRCKLTLLRSVYLS